jgi:dUTP pyrophosphatase
VGLLFPRSSLSKQGITMTNSVGVIDSDYRGEIMASLMFNGVPGNCNEIDIPAGERIVQLVVVPIVIPLLEVNSWSDEEWNDTQRGTGGFGSTGKA